MSGDLDRRELDDAARRLKAAGLSMVRAAERGIWWLRCDTCRVEFDVVLRRYLSVNGVTERMGCFRCAARAAKEKAGGDRHPHRPGR